MSGGTGLVIAASASNAATMPAHGILMQQLTAGADGDAAIIGQITGVDTSLFGPGDTIYVGPDGGYVNVKPTGSNLIQNLGIVKKVDASNGTGEIFGSGRSNDLPNIAEGNVWVGDVDGVPQAVATSSFVASDFPYSGSAQITGSLGVTGSISRSEGGFSGSVVDNITDTFTAVPEIDHIVTLTQAEYDGLGSVDANTLYIISGSTVTSEFPYTGSAVISGSLEVTGKVSGNVVSVTPASSTASFNLNDGSFFTSSLTDTQHLEFTNVSAGITAQVELTTAGTPVVDFGSNVLQPSGSEYSPSDAGGRDILTVTSLDGTNVFIVSANKFI